MPAAGASVEAIGQTNGIAALAQTGRGGVLARTGVGVYTLTLDRPNNIADCAVECVDQGAAAPAGVTFNIAHTSDLVKTITRIVYANGAAYAQPAVGDGAFSWIVYRFADPTG